MKVLHICNDFCGSKVHTNLYRELDRLGLSQTVFTCYRGGYPEGTNSFEAFNTDFVYKGVLSTKHRFFFHYKINTVYKELIQSVDPNDYTLTHAVTMFTDGAVAYKLFKDYGIPYIISVRNTDINEFLAVAPHTWGTGIKVLLNAKKIIFLSKAPKEKFCRHFLIKQILPKIKDKFIVQPNGIDDFWLDNVSHHINLSHNIIYVGKFDINKNVVRLIHAVLQLKKEIGDVQLHLVGGDGSREKTIMKLVEAHKDCLFYHGKVYDILKLCELYRQSSVFAMPSIHETFGLVYLEALSQNLPVLYTKDQGIDGLFDSHVGEPVNPFSTESIKIALRKLLLNRSYYSFKNTLDLNLFRWEVIAKEYLSCYEEVI